MLYELTMSDSQDVAVLRKRPLWWRIVRAAIVIACIVLLTLVGVIVGFRLLHDFENMPLCGKQTYLEVENWLDQGKRRALPNVEGRSIESLAKLKGDESQDTDEWNEKYQYLPGLRRGDPGDLVLMYMKVPTRWVHHAAGPPSVFAEHRWVLVPLDFTEVGTSSAKRVDREIPYGGESFERVSLDELKDRLRKTLTFLEDNNRPHWQTVVAENEAFLESTKSE